MSIRTVGALDVAEAGDDRAAIADVARCGIDAETALAERFRFARLCREVEVDGDDGRALLSQPLDGRQTDAARSAGDHGDLLRKCAHRPQKSNWSMLSLVKTNGRPSRI
jgi:hypothetical protein